MKEAKCQKCGRVGKLLEVGVNGIWPTNRFGASKSTLLCKQCDANYMREKREFADYCRSVGQE